MQIDPVCGMQVDEKTAQYKTEYKGGPVGMGEEGRKPWWKFW